jgi:hypothetical protein
LGAIAARKKLLPSSGRIYGFTGFQSEFNKGFYVFDAECIIFSSKQKSRFSESGRPAGVTSWLQTVRVCRETGMPPIAERRGNVRFGISKPLIAFARNGRLFVLTKYQ